MKRNALIVTVPSDVFTAVAKLCLCFRSAKLLVIAIYERAIRTWLWNTDTKLLIVISGEIGNDDGKIRFSATDKGYDGLRCIMNIDPFKATGIADLAPRAKADLVYI